MKSNLRRFIQSAIIASVCGLFFNIAAAQSSPAGLWQSIDETSGKPRAIIRVSEAGGIFTGVIESSLTPNPSKQPPRCELCTDDRKDQLLLGMQIIRGVRKSASGALWEGGEILDPDKGKIYPLQLRMLSEGRQLQVRGMIGPFFRNQTWNRVE